MNSSAKLLSQLHIIYSSPCLFFSFFFWSAKKYERPASAVLVMCELEARCVALMQYHHSTQALESAEGLPCGTTLSSENIGSLLVLFYQLNFKRGIVFMFPSLAAFRFR